MIWSIESTLNKEQLINELSDWWNVYDVGTHINIHLDDLNIYEDLCRLESIIKGIKTDKIPENMVNFKDRHITIL